MYLLAIFPVPIAAGLGLLSWPKLIYKNFIMIIVLLLTSAPKHNQGKLNKQGREKGEVKFAGGKKERKGMGEKVLLCFNQ